MTLSQNIKGKRSWISIDSCHAVSGKEYVGSGFKKVQQSRLDELVQSAKKGNILAKLMEVADTDPHLRKK